ncbi:MAG TPA: undecaprenyl diphosphate synthase family protein [Spirochaetia bacterium]|nr:undecaprenyl diphosphate synthase family protein [Spirochaetia bacterium]
MQTTAKKPLDPVSPPRHIGILMGNRRDNGSAGASRYRGSLAAARRLIEAAAKFSVSSLSLYCSATEETELEGAFPAAHLAHHIADELHFLQAHNLRVVLSGNLSSLPANLYSKLEQLRLASAGNDGMIVNLCLSGGGRSELVRAANRIIEQRRKHTPGTGTNAAAEPLLTEQQLADSLDLPELPEPDLIIRTGGDCRLTGFPVWQSTYSEFLFSEKEWQDWTAEDLSDSIVEFQHRSRRFGGAQ